VNDLNHWKIAASSPSSFLSTFLTEYPLCAIELSARPVISASASRCKTSAMEKLIKKILKRDKDKRVWPNPKDSIGNLVGKLPDGKSTYWIANGPAREVWKHLGREVRNCIQNGACEYGSALLSVELYMFGVTEETAAPQILVCSVDKKARDQVLRAIERSDIMNSHPAIGLGQISSLGELKRLSEDDIEYILSHNPNIGNETVVLTAVLDKPFGRRLFIPKRDGSFLRPATAGPILYINGKIYQLTVGHAFLESGDFPLSQAGPGKSKHRDTQNQNETGDGNAGGQLELTGESSSAIRRASTCSAAGNRLQESSSSLARGSSMGETTRQASLDSGVGLTRYNSPATNNGTMPRKLEALGKLALLSDTSIPNSPDYALIELDEEYSQGSNQVPCDPKGFQRFLQVRQESRDGPRDVSIITMTTSSGFMTGKLCATPSYVRFPNQRNFQELYPILLEGKLADGDCGAGVVDQANGHMYGHIVAGTAGTGHAYIVPVGDIFQDIEKQLGAKATLVPPGQVLEPLPEERLEVSKKLKGRGKKANYSEEVHRGLLQSGFDVLVLEFASPEYLKQLKQHTDKVEEDFEAKMKYDSHHLPVLPETSALADTSRERSINRVQPLTQKQASKNRLDITQPLPVSLPQISALKSRFSTVNGDTKGKGKATEVLSTAKSKILPFEEHFFGLPSDIRVHIIGYLCVPDIFNLRKVSKDWLEFITVNETPISRAFLEHNPVPRFAIDLYPLPAPSELDFCYISQLWHRLSVISKLSKLLADWITTDIFLQKNDIEQLKFLPHKARIHRRLIPMMFTLSHFFETYRQLHLKHVLENDHSLLPENFTFNPVERHIMNMYDNKTLLQTHQVFPVLVSCLSRRLRPPSYYGRLERSLHGYVRTPLPHSVHVGILCIGGLEEVTRILRHESLDDRRLAVDNWYSSVLQQPINYTPETRRWPLAFGQKTKRPSSSASVDESTHPTSASTSSRPRTAHGNCQEKPRDIKGKGKQKASSNVLSGAATERLSPEHARLLLQGLPALEQIWIPTAEALLLARHTVERWQDIKRNGQAMHELILDEFTAADGLFYGCNERDFSQDKARRGWGDLLDHSHPMGH
jgi:hypothetical protein